MLTLDFLLRFSSRKPILFFFMSPRRTFKSLILRRRDLLQNSELKRIIMRSCENCSRLNKKCWIKKKSNKCVKCVRFDRRCDLFYSIVEWKRVKIKRDHVLHDFLDAHQKMFETNIKMQKTMIKITRLQTQFQFLKNKKQFMIEREFRNIAELEKNEKKFNESTLNDFFFDVFFERIKISSNFDWLNFSVETVAEAFNSSWNFLLILKCLRYVHNLFTWLNNETDFEFLVDSRYSLLRIRRSDFLNQFLKILFGWVYPSVQVSKEKYEISIVFAWMLTDLTWSWLIFLFLRFWMILAWYDLTCCLIFLFWCFILIDKFCPPL